MSNTEYASKPLHGSYAHEASPVFAHKAVVALAKHTFVQFVAPGNPLNTDVTAWDGVSQKLGFTLKSGAIGDVLDIQYVVNAGKAGASSGSGVNTLAALIDVDLTGLVNGSMLIYNSLTSKWEIVNASAIVTDEVLVASLPANVWTAISHSIPNSVLSVEVLDSANEVFNSGIDIRINGTVLELQPNVAISSIKVKIIGK